VNRLLIHERVSDDGARERTWLELVDGTLTLFFDDEGERSPVHPSLLDAVMKRYGRPLDDDVDPSGPRLSLDQGRTLSLLRHRARYDVIARDFLVYEAPGAEPLAELASSVSAALAHLVRATRRD
jgi:hypothetical protein